MDVGRPATSCFDGIAGGDDVAKVGGGEAVEAEVGGFVETARRVRVRGDVAVAVLKSGVRGTGRTLGSCGKSAKVAKEGS